MAHDWPTRRVRDIAIELGDAPFGSALKNEHYTDHGALVVQGKNIQGRMCDWSDRRYVSLETYEKLKRSRCRPGDIVFPKVGTIGKVGILTPLVGQEQYILSTNTMRFRPDPQIADDRYVYYYFSQPSIYAFINAINSKSVQPVFNFTTLKDFEITVPPLAEQRAIAETLGSLDDKIEQNRRTGRKLEELARAVFKAWFVDFEPVKAKAAGATAFPGMPPETFATLPKTLKDSPLGPVPEGWEVKTLEEMAEAVKGLSYKGSGLVPADAADLSDALPLHNLNSVYEGGGYKNEGIKRYRGEYKDRHVIYPGDLIVTNTEQGHEYRLIGFPAIVPKRFGNRGLFSHHIFRVRPLPASTLGIQFLYHAIMSGRIREEIVGCTNGTTVNMLSVDGLKRPRICVPPADVANVFELQVATMYDLSESLRDESAKVAALRDYLLPRLLSGKVRVGGL